MKRRLWVGGWMIGLMVVMAGCGINQGDREEKAETTAQRDRIPMVLVGGQIYYDTGEESKEPRRCGLMDGTITSAVSQEEIPTEEDQSNFGTGYGYQFGPEGTLVLLIDEQWMVFGSREEAKP